MREGGSREGVGGECVWEFMSRFNVYLKHTCVTYITAPGSSSNPCVCQNMKS